MEKIKTQKIKRKGTDSLSFRHVLAGVMKVRNLSIRQVAALATVSPSVVQSWLSGGNPHDLRAVARLSKALGLSLEELLLGEEQSLQFSKISKSEFDEVDLFDGLCRVSIRKVIPKIETK